MQSGLSPAVHLIDVLQWTIPKIGDLELIPLLNREFKDASPTPCTGSKYYHGSVK
jgi:hypothetical protein